MNANASAIDGSSTLSPQKKIALCLPGSHVSRPSATYAITWTGTQDTNSAATYDTAGPRWYTRGRNTNPASAHSPVAARNHHSPVLTGRNWRNVSYTVLTPRGAGPLPLPRRHCALPP